MSIKVVDTGMFLEPKIICDVCGEEITEEKQGFYLFEVLRDGKINGGVLFFAHRGSCIIDWDNSHKNLWYSVDVRALPVYLMDKVAKDVDECLTQATLNSR